MIIYVFEGLWILIPYFFQYQLLICFRAHSHIVSHISKLRCDIIIQPYRTNKPLLMVIQWFYTTPIFWRPTPALSFETRPLATTKNPGMTEAFGTSKARARRVADPCAFDQSIGVEYFCWRLLGYC